MLSDKSVTMATIDSTLRALSRFFKNQGSSFGGRLFSHAFPPPFLFHYILSDSGVASVPFRAFSTIPYAKTLKYLLHFCINGYFFIPGMFFSGIFLELGAQMRYNKK